MIVDGTNAVLGRLASMVAKKLLMGEHVVIINVGKIVSSGDTARVHKRYFEKASRGSPQHGPFFSKKPAMLVRRTIRGMLPYKQEKGASAFKRLRVFEDAPSEYKGAVKISKTSDDLSCKYMTLEDLCKRLG